MNPLATSDLRNDAQSKPGQATQVPGLAEVWIINKPFRGPQTEATRSGRLVIQDFASIVAGLVAEVRPDQVVLDLCAAPGNKTSHLAALMNNRGRIYSVDISDRRLERWKEEMGRTGVEIADCVRANAAMLPLEVEADVVLVDPPCSNTGVFARNPSAKWSVTQKRLTDQVARQRAILRDSANHVKPGGTLVYCTCSILPEENEFVVEDFLRVSGEFQLAKQTPFIGSPGLRGLERCQRFYPHIHECNGYFIARFRRAI
jgi:16S rRNA (cytosine967-C5)-methyltransferase